MWDEAQCNREAIPFKRAKPERVENALKTSAADLRIPVLASLLSDELLSIRPMNGHPLCCCASLILVSRNLELLWEFGQL